MGAVIGSKNLKAIAVRGYYLVNFYNKNLLKQLVKWGLSEIKNNYVMEKLKKCLAM